MVAAIKHAFVSAKSDGADATIVRPSDQNADHVVDNGALVAAKLSATATDKVFGRSTAGAGNGEEIPMTAAGRALVAGASVAAQRTTLGIDYPVGEFALTSDISPAQLTANTNDWAPAGLAGSSVIRFSTDATRQLTGLTGGVDGREIVLMNVGTFPLVILNDVTSTAANRFLLPGLTDDVIFPGASTTFWYDSTSSRWRPKGVQVNPIVRRLNTQHSNSTTTPTKATELDCTLQPGTYTFNYILIVRAATAGVAPQFNFNFTGTGAPRWWFMYADLSATLLAAIGQAASSETQTLGFGMSQAVSTEATTAVGNMGPAGGLQSTATDTMVQITGIVVVTAVGNLELWHGSETATATTVEVGSSLIVFKTA